MALDLNYRRVRVIDGHYTIETETKLADDSELCKHCGAHDDCPIRRQLAFFALTRGIFAHVRRCQVFVPVLAFRPPLVGLDGEFNTFRLGAAAARRMKIGARIALIEAGSNAVIGHAQVTKVIAGNLDEMLAEHAHLNHTMLQTDPQEAPSKLRHVLVKSYGPLIVREANEASVIYLMREGVHEVQAVGASAD